MPLKPKNTHTEIDLKDLENIKLIQYKRSQVEDTFIESYKRLGLANKKTSFWAFTKNPKKRTLMLAFNGIRASRKIRIGFFIRKS
jgi:hypothetical protein